VEWFVSWGLEHRVLESVQSIGIDEIYWGRGRRSEAFLTVIYQIDGHCRRLLWVGRKRTKASSSTCLPPVYPNSIRGRFLDTIWKSQGKTHNPGLTGYDVSLARPTLSAKSWLIF